MPRFEGEPIWVPNGGFEVLIPRFECEPVSIYVL